MGGRDASPITGGADVRVGPAGEGEKGGLVGAEARDCHVEWRKLGLLLLRLLRLLRLFRLLRQFTI